MKWRSSKQQQQTVSGVLGSLLPPEASVRFRKWFPVSKVSFYTFLMHQWADQPSQCHLSTPCVPLTASPRQRALIYAYRRSEDLGQSSYLC